MKAVYLRAILSVMVFSGLFWANPAYAQNASGTLLGRVTDPSGGVIVAATITVTNQQTHESRTLETNGSGDYTFPLLVPGVYSINASAQGFQSKIQSGIVLDVDKAVRADISLPVGSSSATVTVSANSLSLDTDSASVGQVITGEQINSLPLFGRNFQDLMFLAPGAVNNPGGEQSIFRITVSGTGLSSISVGGSRGSSQGYTVDGTTILDIGYDTPAFGPSLDSVAEFNELTKSYSAAYGYSMNQINVVSKSGTNQYHGSVFEYLHNNYVDALAHGTVPGSAGQILRLNQFGYSLGGPVKIPWLYNGANKTFFFANYEGFRQSAGGGSATPASVPTADEMKGIFSPSVLGNFTAAQAPTGVGYTQCGHTYHAGDPHPLFDPFDPRGCPFPIGGDGNYTIPASRISNLGKLIMRPGLYYPAAPNVSGVAVPVNNYLYSSKSYLNFDQQNYRIDQNIGSKDQLFFHAVKHDMDSVGTAAVLANAKYASQPGRLYTMTETHLFNPTLTNQIRVGFMEALYKTGPSTTVTPADLSLLHFPNAFTSKTEGYPRLEFDGTPLNNGYTYGGGVFGGSVSFSDDSVWDIGESANWSVKRHNISFGLNYRRIRLNLNPGLASLGRVNYNGQYSGDVFADALLGASVGIALSQVGPFSNPEQGPEAHLHFNWWAPYIQDDWKVSNRLTLNLGLRYEFIATPYEENNFFVWPDFDAPGGALYMANSSIAKNFGGSNPFAPGTGLYVSPPNGQRGPGPVPKNVLAPRIGFAYRLFNDDKTVVRGGFGKYFDTIEANEYQASSAGVYPLVASVSTGTNAGLSYPPAYDTNNLPAAPPSSPILSYATNPTTSQLGFLQIQAGRILNPYFLAWNFGVQRELPGQNKLEVDYIGNHGQNLFSRSNPNAPKQCIAANGCTVTANTPATIPWQQRTPYPNLGTLVYAGFDGFSNYNALNVELEHRSSNLSLIAAYTWSKGLDTKSSVAGFSGDPNGWAGPQDGRNIAADYGPGNFDVGQQFRITMVAALPFGKGRRFYGNAPGVINAAIGGWQFGTSTYFQGGLPFTVTANDIQGANNTFAERANRNAKPAGFHRTLDQWYSYSSVPGSTDAEFTQPAPGYYGNSGRNSLRMPGQINSDMSLSKTVPISERLNFQLRCDAFNATNHWNPGQPGNYSVSGTNVGKIFPFNSQTSARVLQLAGRLTF